MTVIATARRRPPGTVEVTFVDTPTLLADSECITVHTPLPRKLVPNSATFTRTGQHLSVPVKDCEGCPARAGVRNLEADDPSGGRPALHCNFCESDHSIEPAPRRLLPRRVRRPRRGRRHRGRVRTPQSISSRCSTTRRWRRSSRG